MYVFFTERQSECPKLAADILRKIENHFARSARRIRIVKNREKEMATVSPLRNAGASLSAQRFGRNRRQLPDFSPCRMLLAPPFGTKRWRQKCPQGTSVGIGRRFSLSGHKRLRCFAHPLRALEPPSDLIPPPVQCGDSCALRATMIICWRPCMAGLGLRDRTAKRADEVTTPARNRNDV